MKSNRQLIRKRLIFFSFLLFPFTVFYFSPFLIVVASIDGILCGSMVLFIIQFISSLFCGRAFCGWACPGAGIQECCLVITDKRSKNNKLRYIKYIIFAPWLLSIAILLFRAGGIQLIDPLFMTNGGMPMRGIEGYIIYFGIIGLFTALTLGFGSRTFCHVFCWMAPFMVFGTWIKNKIGYQSLRLKSEPAKCVDCKRCNKICPMGLNTAEMVKTQATQNYECILCGECENVCRHGAVFLTWSRE